MTKIRTGVVARTKRPLASLAVAGLAGLSLHGAAHAADDAAMATADAEDQRGHTVSGIDVEARRPQENPKAVAKLLDTPQTVTVVSRGVIQAQNLLSLRDVLSTVPGITFGAGEGGGGFGDSINLRGYSANNDITVDNVRDSAQYSRSDTFNIEQIEVTNGANSVQSGAGAVGGTINIVSKRPGRRDSVEVSAGVGTDNYYRGTLDANQRINESVAVRLNAMVHRNDVPGRDVERARRWGFAPSITIGMHSPTQFTAQYFHQQDNNIPTYGAPYYNGGPVPGVDPSNYYGYRNVDRQKTKVDIFTGIVDHDFGEGLKLRNLARYQEVEQDLTVNPPQQGGFCLSSNLQPAGFTQTSTATNITGYAACIAGSQPGFYTVAGPRGTARYSRNTLLYNQTDLSWAGEFAGLQHSVTFGFSFLSEDYKLKNGNVQRAANGATPAFPNQNIANPDNIYRSPINFIQAGAQYGERKNQAVYMFDNVELTPQWSVNFGLRFEHNQGLNRTDVYSVVVGPTLGTVTYGGPNRSDEQLLTYRAGVVFKPIPNASIYAAYGNSETPSQATVNGSGACVAGGAAGNNCTVDPEKAENIEVGAKWDVGGQLSLTGALFRNKRSDYRVASNDPTIPSQQLDGTARVDGITLGASGRFTERWSVFANYTYLKSKVLQGVSDFDKARDLDFTAGDALLQVPDHAFSLFTTYDLPNDKLQVGYGLSYQGETYLTQHGLVTGTANTRTTVPLVKSDDYMVHRLVITWRPLDRVELQLNVNNVFDKEYYTSIRNNGWAMPGDTRNARLALNYRF